METNLQRRLTRNTSLPLTSGLLPMFEAVVNSIQAIEECGLNSSQGQIRVVIQRKGQGLLDFAGKKKPGREVADEIIGFSITDNGVGFNVENFKSFETLDSDHKSSIGCRGIGRLLWLIAFKTVRIQSVFVDPSNKLKLRTFSFDPIQGVINETLCAAPNGAARQTHVHLDGFVEKYRQNASKSAKTISEEIIEHAQWYFIRPGSAPSIVVEDDGESISLNDIFDERMVSNADTETFLLKGEQFHVTHVKIRTVGYRSNCVAFCADNRLVLEEKLGTKIPGLKGRLRDEKGEFSYVCYISSQFLDNHSRPERTGFNIVDTVDSLLDHIEISMDDIRKVVIQCSYQYLEAFLTDIKTRGLERVTNYVNSKAPKYRPILSRISPTLTVDPDLTDKELEGILHRCLYELESDLIAKGHEIMADTVGDNLLDYKTKLSEYLSTAEDLKKSDLASYVSHRRVIIDLLEKELKRRVNGAYQTEEVLHSLIMPMGKESTEILYDTCNLWLIDERLAFHNYLASDKTLRSMPVTGDTTTKEPDLFALNMFDNPLLVSEGTRMPLSSLVVVELKRPMRNDAKEGESSDPIEQALGYLERIRSGKVQTKEGRQIPTSEDIPGFCYIICDLTSTMINRCKVHDMTPTTDHLGYFTYKSRYKAYVEVISFDRLVNSAKERNRAFFDKLGLPGN